MEQEFKHAPAKSSWRWIKRGVATVIIGVPLGLMSGCAYVGWKIYRGVQAVQETYKRGETVAVDATQAAIAKAGDAAARASAAARQVKQAAMQAGKDISKETAKAVAAARRTYDENGGASGILHQGEAAGRTAIEATEAAAGRARKAFKESGAEQKLRDGASAGAGKVSEYYGEARGWLGQHWQPATPVAPAAKPKPVNPPAPR